MLVVLVGVAQVLRLRHVLLHHLVDIVLVFKVRQYLLVLRDRRLLQEVAARAFAFLGCLIWRFVPDEGRSLRLEQFLLLGRQRGVVLVEHGRLRVIFAIHLTVRLSYHIVCLVLVCVAVIGVRGDTLR